MRLALCYNFALFHQVEIVAELRRKAQIMQSSQNRNVQFLDNRKNLQPITDIQMICRLVEDQDLG